MAIQVAAAALRLGVTQALKPSRKEIAGDVGRGIANGLSMNVSSNMKKFERRLNDFQRRQLPFAMSKTINDVIFSVRRQIVSKTMPRSFDVRDKRFLSQTWRVETSNKKRLKATLFDRLDNANLRLHAEGGVKRGKRGDIAIPTKKWLQPKRRSKGVPSRYKPNVISKSKKGYYEENEKGRFIYEEYGRKGSKRRTLYTIKPSAKIKKTFPFFRDANKIARRRFDRSFAINFRKALRTARK